MTDAARLLEALSSRAPHPALVLDRSAISYGELDGLSRRYAARLRRLGIGAGDRVAVFSETCPEMVVAFLGHLRSGVVHVPINARYKSQEARHILEDSGARAVLVRRGDACAPVLEEILSAPPAALTHRLDLEEWAGPAAGTGDTGADSPDVLPDGGAAAVLVYTSGTTGKSKGVALSSRALARNTLAVTTLWRFGPDDRVVVALPLFHVHGLCLGIVGALLHGATILLEPRFDAAALVDAFARRGASVFMGVPTMYALLLEHLEARPGAAAALARARLFTSGSAALPAPRFAAFRERTGHAILERYGMSETLFTLSNPYEGERRPGTVGRPVPGCGIRVVDDAGADAAPGEMGELWVTSNGMMNGYWGRASETAASFRDGWFVTGDMARAGADGSITILGRKSVDFIKSGGFKISAREIEDVVRRHPLVRDAAVVGAPDPVWGERIVAAVVLAEAAEPRPSEQELLAQLGSLCAGALADYKRPREVRIVAELPRNALGKIQKHRILEILAASPPPTETS